MSRQRTRAVAIATAMLVTLPVAALAAVPLSGPAFGMDVTPGGTVVVADASVGVVIDSDPPRTIPLPGVSDVEAVNEGLMWATTSVPPEDGPPQGVSGLHRVTPRGGARLVADLGAFEAANDPDGNGVESNPFDVASLGRSSVLVADAAGNDLLRVRSNGGVAVVAVFPPSLVPTQDLKDVLGCPNPPPGFEDLCFLPPEMPAEAVPTSVAIGPDGAAYVGELRGFPAPRDHSSIWRVDPGARGAECPGADCTAAFDRGFTSIIDLHVGPDGLLYVLELDEAGWLAAEFGLGVGGTLNRCDVATGQCIELLTGLPLPTSVAVDETGVHLIVNGPIPGLAEVVSYVYTTTGLRPVQDVAPLSSALRPEIWSGG